MLLNSMCAARISTADTACDSPEICLQSGEIHPQPARHRNPAMDSRACRDTHRPTVFAKHPAPPASLPAPHGFAAFKATVRGSAAMEPLGAGAVGRAGSVVAPAPLVDGSGIVLSNAPNIQWLDISGILSLQTDTSACYSRRNRPEKPDDEAFGPRDSRWTRRINARASASVRGDRSRHLLRQATGTRSGDRRDVSLSPVPASHQPAIGRPCDNRPSRIRRDRVAKLAP